MNGSPAREWVSVRVTVVAWIATRISSSFGTGGAISSSR
jgi:hypothetical protein